MGFMNQFRQQQQSSNDLSSLFSQAKSLADESGGAQAAIQKLIDNGATCTMPSGKVIPVSQIVSMAQGKTVNQLIEQLLQS